MKCGPELSAERTEARYLAFEEVIRSIPRGRVASYGQVAEAAGYPRGHRLVARFLSTLFSSDIPWQRVVGAGGEIKPRGSGAAKQEKLLKAEGVIVARHRVDMREYQHSFE